MTKDDQDQLSFDLTLPEGFDVSKKYNDSHIHTWRHYIGFTEEYWYCEDCDEKRYKGPIGENDFDGLLKDVVRSFYD